MTTFPPATGGATARSAEPNPPFAGEGSCAGVEAAAEHAKSGIARHRTAVRALVALVAVTMMPLAGCRHTATWTVQWQAPGERPTGEWINIHSPKTSPPRFRLEQVPGGVMAWRAEIASGPPERVFNLGGQEIRGGQRAEGVGPSETEASGTVRYEWRTMFDPTFPNYDNNDVWQVFAQWHQGDPPKQVGSSPPVAFTVDSGQIYVQLHSAPTSSGGPSTFVGDSLIGPVAAGQWHNFVAEITWSTDPAVGSVAVWHNGNRVKLEDKETYFGQTLFPGATGCPDQSIPRDVDCAYMKMGFYRKAVEKPVPFVVWHDDVRQMVKR